MNKDNFDITDSLFAFTAMSGIFPDAAGIDAFWRKILTASKAGLVPLEERWGLDRSIYFDPEPGKPGYIYLDKAFCLPELFHLRGRQIAYGRKVLKRLCRRLHMQNQLPDPARTGLVIASCWNDQEYYQGDIDFIFKKDKSRIPATPGFHYSPEEKLDTIAASVNLGGPRLAVDTACASSLYGIIDAISLIMSGQAEAVMVLGLNVTVPPFLMGTMSQVMALAADGRCLPFSDEAAGMVPGESACAVLVEPLGSAVQAGREILGVLRAVGLSADGSEGSVFGPGVKGQLSSYQRAYKNIDPATIDYIEAHGTATMLGDATEIETLDFFFRDVIPHHQKLPIGSIKSLVGHTIAAAGMVSLIKALLMIREKTIPPHIPISPHPRLADSCLCLTGTPHAIHTNGKPIRIGVSSFGLGGSNSHMVIESNSPPGRGSKLSPKPHQMAEFEEIAIIDMEAAFGHVIGADKWQECIRQNTFSYDVFPGNRFFKSFENAPKGLFFPDVITIDTNKFRTGPKLIPYMDTFQNLGTHLVGKILERHPSAAHSQDTGIALCCNNGGAKGFQLSRRFLRDYVARIKKEHPLHNNIDSKIHHLKIEELSSTLASMFSGFPAYHFNLRAFHQTLSGNTDLFWNLFQTAPYLLSSHCKQLFIGAGSYVKTPLDLCYPGLSGNGNTPYIVEGIGIFLLKTLKCALKDGDRCLGVIKSVVTQDQASDFTQACKRAGIHPGDVDVHEICQLRPDATKPTSPSNHDHATTANWFLYEASGIDALSAALLKQGKLAAITVFAGDRYILTTFIEKRHQWRNASSSVFSPLEISFIDKHISGKTTGENQLATNDRNKYGSNDIKPFLANSDQKKLLLWHDHVFANLQKYFKIQNKLAQKLSSTAQSGKPMGRIDHEKPPEHCRSLDPVASNIKQDKNNIVIKSACFDEQSHTFSAYLLVDESNSYFFDHPLDHVPGILLLEGALQLFDTALADIHGNSNSHKVQITKVDITFHHWCEKDIPVLLGLSRKQSLNDSEVPFSCCFEQGNKIVCSANLLGRKVTENENIPQIPRDMRAVPVQDKKILHKHLEGNVIVTNIALDPDNPDIYVCETLPPPNAHLLNDGHPSFFSMVYLLEACRQCATLCSHSSAHASYETKMTLLKISIALDRPPHKKEMLKLKRIKPRSFRVGNRFISENDFSFIGSGNAIGTCRITALTEDEESYEMNRWKI